MKSIYEELNNSKLQYIATELLVRIKGCGEYEYLQLSLSKFIDSLEVRDD